MPTLKSIAEGKSNRVQQEIAPGVLLDADLALWFQEPRCLVIADIHWGYALTHRRRGHLFPEWGNDEIAGRIGRLIEFYQPQEMIWLGDTVHSWDGRKLAEEFIAQNSGRVKFTLVQGNHDKAWTVAATKLVTLAGYTLHHGDSEIALPPNQIEVVGHWHPALSWRDGAGLRLKLPALIQGASRWILPAFSPWAGGVDWRDRLQTGEQAWLISPRRILPWPKV
jgi:uncharacterized protein